MAALPHAFRRIRLELAREPGHPEGSHRFGYEFVAPLGDEGRIDPKLWKAHRDECRERPGYALRVHPRRFWADSAALSPP